MRDARCAMRDARCAMRDARLEQEPVVMGKVPFNGEENISTDLIGRRGCHPERSNDTDLPHRAQAFAGRYCAMTTALGAETTAQSGVKNIVAYSLLPVR
jgi:hypothetical protein